KNLLKKNIEILKTTFFIKYDEEENKNKNSASHLLSLQELNSKKMILSSDQFFFNQSMVLFSRCKSF
ncbi:hypothetical protein, partial [Escherichia coli]|uniref:hypothetical protein n=1 Tax=Escherichia coli TaxID=562 RepID=UPI001BFC44D2